MYYLENFVNFVFELCKKNGDYWGYVDLFFV